MRRGTVGFLGGDAAAVKGMRTNASAAGRKAYTQRLATTKKRAVMGAGIYAGSMAMTGNQDPNWANQNTLVTRRLRGQNIGLSSGALQSFESYRSSRAIGGMT